MQFETEDDIFKLIEQGVPESYHFEYKRQPWPKNQKGNVELAKDISALANTEGGVIIIGIDEDKKTNRLKAHPIEFEDIKDRITTVLEQNVKDPIPGYRIQLIPPNSNLGFVVIEIPDSPSKPHMVTVKGEQRHYKRVNALSIPMTNSELGQLYAMKYEQEKKLEEYYAALFKIAKNIQEKIEAEVTQWFIFFLPLPFRPNRFNLYHQDFLNQLKREIKHWFDLYVDKPLTYLSCFGFSDREDYEIQGRSIWVQSTGGILVVSPKLTSNYPDPLTGRVVLIDWLPYFLENSFRLVRELYPPMQNIQSIVLLKNIAGWEIFNFYDRYDENFNQWLKAFQSGAVPWIGRVRNNGKEPDIKVEHNISMWELEETNFRNCLKESILKQIFRGFGYHILDK